MSISMRNNKLLDNPAISEYKSHKFTKENGLYPYNNTTETVYGYTNENLRQYINLLNLSGGRVATTGSSFDQVLYAVYQGAEEVTLLDGCPYAIPMGELKISAIKNMSLSEFNDYWNSYNVFDKGYYNELLADVSDNTVEFLAFVENRLKHAKRKYDVISNIIKPHSFPARSNYYKNGCEFYDNDKNFAKLKTRLRYAHINSELVEYHDFPKVLTGKYSSIMLSNIYDYIGTSKFFEVARDMITNNLANGGTMQLHYAFSSYNKTDVNLNNFTCLDKTYNRYGVQNVINMDKKKKSDDLAKKYTKYGANEFDETVYIYEKD